MPEFIRSDRNNLPENSQRKGAIDSCPGRYFYFISAIDEFKQVGTVVHMHRDAAAYEVEFMTLTGKTVALAIVLPSQLRPVSKHDMTHVRELAVS